MAFSFGASAKVFLGCCKFLRYGLVLLTCRLFYCNHCAVCIPTLCYPFLFQDDVVLVWRALDDIRVSDKT